MEALLGKELTLDEAKKARDGIYFYVDLSNEQVFLRQNGRVSDATWILWRDGIGSNLSRPAFEEAWKEFKKEAPNIFLELRRLEESDFKNDPKGW